MQKCCGIIIGLCLVCTALSVRADDQLLSITAKSWLVADEKGTVINSVNIDQQRSIASITKLLTVMVVLDANQNLNQKIKPHTRQQLIDLALVRSNNLASEKLCQNYPGGRSNCVRAMNNKAAELGMHHSKFVDPTGLGIGNVSTAADLIRLVQAAQTYPKIVAASKTSTIKIKHKKKYRTYNNTNPIIAKGYKFQVSKTGWITASGGCIVMMLDTALGKRIVILLGSKNTRTRIREAELVANLH
jgi:serine-type D-Ala-D-Ala endopeptidase (penicillin-binding protein 7)